MLSREAAVLLSINQLLLYTYSTIIHGASVLMKIMELKVGVDPLIILSHLTIALVTHLNLLDL